MKGWPAISRGPLPNDTPGPIEGGCGREDCGHAREDHYSTWATVGWPGVPIEERRGDEGRGPCNVRGEWTHCVCYAYIPHLGKVLTPA